MIEIDELTTQLNHQQTAINIIQTTLAHHQTILDTRQNDIAEIKSILQDRQTMLEHITQTVAEISAKISQKFASPLYAADGYVVPPIQLPFVVVGSTAADPLSSWSPTSPPYFAAVAPPLLSSPLNTPLQNIISLTTSSPNSYTETLPSIPSPLPTIVPTSASAVLTTSMPMNNTAAAIPSSDRKLFNNNLTQTQVSPEISCSVTATTLLSSPTLDNPGDTTLTTLRRTINKFGFIDNTNFRGSKVAFSPFGLTSPLTGPTISLVSVLQDTNNVVISDSLEMFNSRFLKFNVQKYMEDESVFTLCIQFLGIHSSLKPTKTSPSVKTSSETKIFIFDPGGIFNPECIVDLEDKVIFEGSVMIRFYLDMLQGGCTLRRRITI